MGNLEELLAYTNNYTYPESPFRVIKAIDRDCTKVIIGGWDFELSGFELSRIEDAEGMLDILTEKLKIIEDIRHRFDVAEAYNYWAE